MVCTLDLLTRIGRVSACLPFPTSRRPACPNVMIASGLMAVPPVVAGAGALRRCPRQPAVMSMTAPAGRHSQGGSETDSRARAASADGAGALAAHARPARRSMPARTVRESRIPLAIATSPASHRRTARHRITPPAARPSGWQQADLVTVGTASGRRGSCSLSRAQLVGRSHRFKHPSPDRCLRLKLAAVFVVQLRHGLA